MPCLYHQPGHAGDWDQTEGGGGRTRSRTGSESSLSTGCWSHQIAPESNTCRYFLILLSLHNEEYCYVITVSWRAKSRYFFSFSHEMLHCHYVTWILYFSLIFCDIIWLNTWLWGLIFPLSPVTTVCRGNAIISEPLTH